MPSRNVYVQTSMGGFTAHDYVCNTIKRKWHLAASSVHTRISNFQYVEKTRFLQSHDRESIASQTNKYSVLSI